MIALFLAPFYVLVNLYLARWVLRWTGACHHICGTRVFRAAFIAVYALVASAPLTGFLVQSPYALRKALLQTGNYWFGWMLYLALAVLAVELALYVIRRVRGKDFEQMQNVRRVQGGVALALVCTVSVYGMVHAGRLYVTGYEVTRGALALFERPLMPRVEELVRDARRVAVLEDIVNYTNVGAIFRSAAALGIDAVLLTPSCHDPLYRRAARVSMGTVFQVPWARIGGVRDWAVEGVPLLRELGFKTAALALSDDSIPIDDGRLASCEKLALVLGTEGDGLAASTIAHCDWTARIPMDHGVDSLNVAAASAVAFWETRVR